MNGNHGTGQAGPGGRGSWPAAALLAVGGWLVVSPLILHTTRVTAGLVSAVGGGLLLAALAGWALVARNRIPPLAIACAFGLWLVLAPSLWEFGDGVDSGPGLVPIAPSDLTEPAQAMVARAEWNSVLAGLLIFLLAGAALVASRRWSGRSAPDGDGEHRRPGKDPAGLAGPSGPGGRRDDL
jgi:hypothetical protein